MTYLPKLALCASEGVPFFIRPLTLGLFKLETEHFVQDKSKIEKPSKKIKDRVDELARQMGIKNDVTIIYSPRTNPAAQMGFNSRFSFPSVLLDSREKDKTLISLTSHELVHVKHSDLLKRFVISHVYQHETLLY